MKVHQYLTPNGSTAIHTTRDGAWLTATGMPVGARLARTEAARLLRAMNRTANRIRPFRDDA